MGSFGADNEPLDPGEQTPEALRAVLGRANQILEENDLSPISETASREAIELGERSVRPRGGDEA